MSPANQTMLARFAAATSIFALLMVGVVAVSVSGKSSGDEATGPAAPVEVSLTEFAINPSAIVVPLGGSLNITNSGTMAHNATVLDSAIKTADLQPGQSAKLDVSSLEPGQYELFCAITGHKDSGMTATLTISDGSAADTAAAEETASGANADHASHASADIGSLQATDPIAKQFDKEMQAGMDDGVATFLDNATKYAEGKIRSGNQVLEPKILPDGTKQFNLTAAVTDWEVSPGKVVKAWTYNGMVPGPWIKVDPGDKVKVNLTNNLPISTDIHWHGVGVPNDQDGVAGITQDYIAPNTTYTYSFTAPNENRMAMYHAHYHGQEAVLNGLFAVFQVGDVPMPAAGTYGNMTVPENVKISQHIPMVLNDAGVIGLSLNGKAFPETEPIVAESGEWIQLTYYNEGLVGHPMHLHSQPQLVIAKDGYALKAPYQVDTLWVAPGERYTILIHADKVGTWAFHCHILNHAESDTGLIGMVTAMVVTDPNAPKNS